MQQPLRSWENTDEFHAHDPDRLAYLGLDIHSRGLRVPWARGGNRGVYLGLFSIIPFRSMIVFWSETMTLILSDSLST